MVSKSECDATEPIIMGPAERANHLTCHQIDTGSDHLDTRSEPGLSLALVVVTRSL